MVVNMQRTNSHNSNLVIYRPGYQYYSMNLDHMDDGMDDDEDHDGDMIDGDVDGISYREVEIREQDRFLPIANIARIMKKILPANAKIAKDAKECIQECVSEFISFITSEASDKCQQEKRKTINGDDILWAMGTLGFDKYTDPLKLYLAKYRDSVRGDKPEKKPSGRKDIGGNIAPSKLMSISDSPSNNLTFSSLSHMMSMPDDSMIAPCKNEYQIPSMRMATSSILNTLQAPPIGLLPGIGSNMQFPDMMDIILSNSQSSTFTPTTQVSVIADHIASSSYSNLKDSSNYETKATDDNNNTPAAFNNYNSNIQNQNQQINSIFTMYPATASTSSSTSLPHITSTSSMNTTTVNNDYNNHIKIKIENQGGGSGGSNGNNDSGNLENHMKSNNDNS